MSQASEEAFDALQKTAISDQKVVLYFCAILPSGEALQVTSSLLPEVLEEIGPMPKPDKKLFPSAQRIGKTAKAEEFMSKLEARGKRLAQLMNKTINPMAVTLIEAITAKHHEK